jgi:hypothetical protein
MTSVTSTDRKCFCANKDCWTWSAHPLCEFCGKDYCDAHGGVFFERVNMCMLCHFKGLADGIKKERKESKKEEEKLACCCDKSGATCDLSKKRLCQLCKGSFCGYHGGTSIFSLGGGPVTVCDNCFDSALNAAPATSGMGHLV